MALIKSLISSSIYSIKSPYTMKAEGICIHNTANDAAAKNEIAYMKSNNNKVSFHIAIDDKEAIQAIEFNRSSWHAGDGSSGKGNRSYIAIEICYSKSGGEKFIAAEKRAAKEIAAILKSYNWGLDKVKAHRDFSSKNCPHRTNMANLKNMIKFELDKLNNIVDEGPINIGDSVKVIGNNYATGQVIPDWVKKEIYTIEKIVGNKALLKEITSWIYLNDLILATKNIVIGSKVKVIGNNYATGQVVPDWVKKEIYTVAKIDGSKVLLKEITSWIYIKDLKIV